MEITLFTRRRPSAACLHLPWAGRPRWSDLPSDLSSGGEHLWTPSVRPRPRLILTYHSSWWSQSVPDQGWGGSQSCHGSFWKNWFRCTTWIQRVNCDIYWPLGFKYREDFGENYPQNVSKIPCFSSGLGSRQRGWREVEINNLHVYINSFHSARPTRWAESISEIGLCNVCLSVITSKMVNISARRLHRFL